MVQLMVTLASGGREPPVDAIPSRGWRTIGLYTKQLMCQVNTEKGIATEKRSDLEEIAMVKMRHETFMIIETRGISRGSPEM